MSDPFRGGGDAQSAHEFSQHLGVAEDQLEQIEAIPRRVEALKSGTGVTQALMDGLVLQYAKGWETLWDQLQAAREVCHKLGRDVSAYDAARAAAGDIYVGVAKGSAFKLGNRVEIKWQNRPTTPAHAAIAPGALAMRTCHNAVQLRFARRDRGVPHDRAAEFDAVPRMDSSGSLAEN